MSLLSLQSSKKALRATINSTLRSLSESEIQDQSRAIATQIIASPFFQRSSCVSCYLNMKSEADTGDLVREILRAGKTLFVPKIGREKGASMEFLKIYGQEDLESLPSGLWGIKEPGPDWNGQRRLNVNDSDSGALDLILLPGVAFDQNLSRLGHGKGYYDRFITAYSAHASQQSHPRPLLVALSLREQLLAAGEVPVTDYDQKMDMIVTPDGIVGADSASDSRVSGFGTQLG